MILTGALPVFCDATLTPREWQNKRSCLFPLPQIPEHAQKVVLQAKSGEIQSKMKQKDKKYQKQ